MTSFAFIAGLVPLVVATGAGAIGNRTIGTTAAGGMLVGTVLGVLVIPGLYYLFGRIADGRKLLRDEVDKPLSEVFEHARASNPNEAPAPPAAAPDGAPPSLPATPATGTRTGSPPHAEAPGREIPQGTFLGSGRSSNGEG
jgi:HAE1 family hydrophobic/amphiphilic exporter-1